MRHLYTPVLAAALTAIALPAAALTATQTVEKEIVVTNPDGSQTVTRKAADTVVPGERIVYTLEYKNDKAEPASDLVLTMPIPEEVKFIDGSATNAVAVVTYSADGGQTFASRESVTVRADDGSATSAEPTDITHVRWLVAGPVAPGDVGELAFKGLLK